jgi:hypothetical protein
MAGAFVLAEGDATRVAFVFEIQGEGRASLSRIGAAP